MKTTKMVKMAKWAVEIGSIEVIVVNIEVIVVNVEVAAEEEITTVAVAVAEETSRERSQMKTVSKKLETITRRSSIEVAEVVTGETEEEEEVEVMENGGVERVTGNGEEEKGTEERVEDG